MSAQTTESNSWPQNAGLHTLDGNAIYVAVEGHGPPIVWLHDGLVHRAGFDGQMAAFSKDFTCIRYDRPGYGDSPPPVAPYTNVSMLTGLFDHLGLPAAILVGGSAGGRLALDFASLHSDRVRALVLVGAAVSGFDFSDHMLNRGWRQPFPESEHEIPDFWASDPWLTAEANVPARARLRQLLTDYPQNAQFKSFEPADDLLALPRLPEIRVPTLVMVGESDIADNHAQAGILATAIPGAERQVVPQAGHLVYLEQPEDFNRRVLDFIGRALPASG